MVIKEQNTIDFLNQTFYLKIRKSYTVKEMAAKRFKKQLILLKQERILQLVSMLIKLNLVNMGLFHNHMIKTTVQVNCVMTQKQGWL